RQSSVAEPVSGWLSPCRWAIYAASVWPTTARVCSANSWLSPAASICPWSVPAVGVSPSESVFCLRARTSIGARLWYGGCWLGAWNSQPGDLVVLVCRITDCHCRDYYGSYRTSVGFT